MASCSVTLAHAPQNGHKRNSVTPGRTPRAQLGVKTSRSALRFASSACIQHDHIEPMITEPGEFSSGATEADAAATRRRALKGKPVRSHLRVVCVRSSDEPSLGWIQGTTKGTQPFPSIPPTHRGLRGSSIVTDRASLSHHRQIGSMIPAAYVSYFLCQSGFREKSTSFFDYLDQLTSLSPTSRRWLS